MSILDLTKVVKKCFNFDELSKEAIARKKAALERGCLTEKELLGFFEATRSKEPNSVKNSVPDDVISHLAHCSKCWDRYFELIRTW